MPYTNAKQVSLCKQDVNILIISPYYFPNINPRPYRWTRIAEYLASQGHRVTVVCEKQPGYSDKETLNGVVVRRIGSAALKSLVYKNSRGVVENSGERLGEKLGTLINRIIVKKLYFPDDSFIWYYAGKREAEKVIIEEKTDVLISSSLPFTAHLIGLNLKKKYPHLLWIADSGDPFSLQTEAPLNNHFLYGRLNRYFERQILNKADYVTVTCEQTHRKYIESYPETALKHRVIPPLSSSVEKTDLHTVEMIVGEAAEDKIRMAYFGKFYEKIRPAQLLTNFLVKLFMQKPEMKERLEIHIFGDIFPEFRAELKRFPQLRLHGLIPREQVFLMMQKMDLLVNISNITDYQLPSKAPDYLNSGKAILNIFTTEEDEFKKFFSSYPAIQHYQSGTTIDAEVLNFIEDARNTQVDPGWIRKEAAKYSVENIAKEYEKLFTEDWK